MVQEFGTCVFDVTLDCEDGGPGGCEIEQAHCVVELARAAHAKAQREQGGNVAHRCPSASGSSPVFCLGR